MEHKGYGIPIDWSREPSECRHPGPQVRQKADEEVGRCETDRTYCPVEQHMDVDLLVADMWSGHPANMLGVALLRMWSYYAAPDRREVSGVRVALD